MTTALTELLIRDLNILVNELKQYSNEKDIWLVPSGINNSAGTLTLHLIGNLNHFIGSILGQTGYVRNRDAEFNDRNIDRNKMISDINETIAVIDNTLKHLSDDTLKSVYPVQVFGEPISTTKFLIHLHGHLNYHLGQVNYHRRLLSES